MTPVTTRSHLGSRVLGAATRSWQPLMIDPASQRFMEHNQRVWKDWQPLASRAEVLFNYDPLCANHVKFSYVMNVLAREHTAVIKAFGTHFPLTERRLRRVYQSFNVAGFVSTVLDRDQRQRRDKLFADVRGGLATKQDVLDLVVDGIDIGLDVYDTYLRITRVPTLALDDPRFDEQLRRGLGLIIFWQDYFARHAVGALCISHDNYLGVMDAAKVAHAVGIPVYSPDLQAPGLRGEHNSAYTACVDFPALFRQLSLEEQQAGLTIAQRQLQRRFAGEVGEGMPTDKGSAFHQQHTGSRVLRETDHLKILICAHEFADAPHDYGHMLFADFYEWMQWLGRFAEQTDYDWYVKLHPDYWPESGEIISRLVAEHPRLNQLPDGISHHQLVAEGIDAVLTCGGTVGHEYPAFGIPVINAGDNPHRAYSFNWHPQSVAEYEDILLDLPQARLPIDQRDIYEFYYMYHYGSLAPDAPLKWWGEFNATVSGADKVRPAFYSLFLDQLSQERHDEAVRHLRLLLPLRLRHLSELNSARVR